MNNRSLKSLWNRDYLLLLQGNFVSAFGDIIYEIALGFWVLAETGSTGIMGTVMAVTVLPRTILSPFAGTIADRVSRKQLIVLADLVRGAAVGGIAVAAIMDCLALWMLFAAGIIIGICAAFFSPAVNSALPDIVPKHQIIRANSGFSMVHTASGIAGNAVGGIMYHIVGAPVLFAANSISFILSAISESFINLKPHKKKETTSSAWSDMIKGIRYIRINHGILNLFFLIAVINFFSSSSNILILPLFRKTPELGPTGYGIVMAGFTFGMFSGFSFMSLLQIKAIFRYKLFIILAIAHLICMLYFPFLKNLFLMTLIYAFYGFVMGINNTIMMGSLQISVPREKLGRIFGFMGMLSGGLTPIGMAAGGIIAEFIAIEFVISSGYAFILLAYITTVFSPSIKNIIRCKSASEKKPT